ncbi:MAG TPA: hypothetical protein VHL80_21105 [Polyangia bacterium]|nr:hypothetical protein [Polyangia bacterium]
MCASGASQRRLASPLAAAAAGVLALACTNGGPSSSGGGAAGAGGSSSGGADAATAAGIAGEGGAGLIGGSAGEGAGGTMAPPGCQSACPDFPSDPLIDMGLSPDVPQMFTGLAPVGAGPCITEPEDGALYPNNWLRPRVKWKVGVPGTLTEVRFHADKEANDLVAYTTSSAWTMPRAIWQGLAANVRDAPVTVTVRPLTGAVSTATFTIAPVAAPGSVVFWATNPADHGAPKPTSSSLQGFAPGDESTVTTLGVPDVQMQTRGANNGLRAVTCIGCHSSTPDGDAVAFLDNYPWSMAIAGVQPGRTGLVPAYVTPGGADAIRQPGMGIFSFSKAHWTTGDRIVISPYYLDMPCGQYKNTASARLAWLDLEAAPVDDGCPVEGEHFGILARNGDARGAANPTWSHDGKTIVYSSTDAGQDGRLGQGAADLYSVPYGAPPGPTTPSVKAPRGMGGAATPLAGASEPDFDEYYPAYSPDDALVVFDRVPAGSGMYANPAAELYFVPATGAETATRLVANDPPACSGMTSPGVNNHWAKWAPSVAIDAGTGRKYYWLIFSSNRYGTPPVIALADKSVVQVSQLYATAVVVDGTSVKTYPAIYLWNQSPATLNTTPAWDPFKIPLVQ